MVIQPMVLDLSHHNEIDKKAGGFASVRAAGIIGIIHKSSQGVGYTDGTYRAKRAAALDAGLLWGAYHFADSSDVDRQIENFMHSAAPDASTLMALDFEPNKARTMSIDQARDFLDKIERKLGRKAVLYSGNLIKETLRKADPFFAAHRLWLAQYGLAPKCPASWSAPWLWQFTGDGNGPKPHAIKGIVGTGIDINSYSGTSDQLKAEWASASVVVPPDPDVYWVVTSHALNLRARPTVASAILATLTHGTRCAAEPVPAEDGGQFRWYKVAAVGKVGWVASQFVSQE